MDSGILLAALALLLSWSINKVLLNIIEEYAIYIGAPIVEEVLKSLPAYFLNKPLFNVHFLFGIGEGIYDWFNGKKEAKIWAAIASIISHSIFGGVTFLVLKWTSSMIWAILSSIVIHTIWNYVIMNMGRNPK